MASLEPKNYARLGIFMVMVLSSSLTPAQDYSVRVRNARTDSAYKKLLDAHIFNFGGVGFASQITPEEKAFRVLLEIAKGKFDRAFRSNDTRLFY